MRRGLPTLALVLAFLPGTALAGDEARIHALAGAGDDAGLAGLLTAVETDPALSERERVSLLHRGLVAAGGLPPSDALRPIVQRHAAEGLTVRGWHDDEGHRVEIERYDTGAAARFVLREWHRHDARGRAHAALAHGTLNLADAFGPGSGERDARRRGFEDALAAAPLHEVAPLRDELSTALRAGWRVERAALIVAGRTGDTALAATLLQHGSSGAVTRMLPELRAAFPPDAAARLFTGAVSRDVIASAAVVQLGAIAPRVPEARDWLVSRLGHERHGVSAAMALGRTADAGTVQQLGMHLHEDTIPLAQMRAALALRLSGRADAHTLLADFAADPAAPVRLRTQVEEWLR